MSKIKAFCAVLLACSFLTACQGQTQEEILSGELIVPQAEKYDTVSVEKADFVKTSKGTAEVKFPIRKDLVWETEGAYYDKIYVSTGDFVKEGDVLATFSIEGRASELEELMRRRERKMEDLAEGTVERQFAIDKAKEYLEGKGSHYLTIAELEIEKQQIEYDQFVFQTTREIDMLTEQIEELEKEVNNNTLVAPFDGVVESVISYASGDRVAAGQIIVSVCSTDKIFLKIDDPERNLRQNMEVEIEAQYQQERVAYSGRVVSVPNVLPMTSTVSTALVELTGEVPTDQLPGRISYQCDTQIIPDVLMIDRNAIHRADGQSYVYLYEDGVIKKRFVAEGFNNNEKIWILDGLKEGQSLILD